MLLYLYAPTKASLDLLWEKASALGHACVGTTWDVGFREEIVSVCDAIVYAQHEDSKAGDDKRIMKFVYDIELPVFGINNIPEMHVTEVKNPKQAKAFRIMIGQMYRTHLRKNADYSSANILGTGEIGLVTRLWDKMARIMNLEGFTLNIASMSYGQPKEAKNEAIADTFMDMAVYAIIALLYRAGKWGR